MRFLLEKVKKILKKTSDELIELTSPPEETQSPKLTIRVENFGGLTDVQRIAKFVSSGNVVILKTKELQRKDLGQFQTGVQKLKRVCDERGWGIIGTEEGYIIVAPKFVKIRKD